MFQTQSDKSKLTTGNPQSEIAIMDTRDWNLCFICQTDERDKPTMGPLSFVKLKHNPERLSANYKEVIDNIQELQ